MTHSSLLLRWWWSVSHHWFCDGKFSCRDFNWFCLNKSLFSYFNILHSSWVPEHTTFAICTHHIANVSIDMAFPQGPLSEFDKSHLRSEYVFNKVVLSSTAYVNELLRHIFASLSERWWHLMWITPGREIVCKKCFSVWSSIKWIKSINSLLLEKLNLIKQMKKYCTLSKLDYYETKRKMPHDKLCMTI